MSYPQQPPWPRSSRCSRWPRQQAANTKAPTTVTRIVDEYGQPLPGAQAIADGAKVPGAPVKVILQWAGGSTAGICTHGRVGCAWPGRIVLRNDAVDADLLHELGHQFDFYAMDDQARLEFLRLMADDRPWTSDPNSPDEQFAEAWRACAVGYKRFFSAPRLGQDARGPGYGFGASRPQLAAICDLIRAARARR